MGSNQSGVVFGFIAVAFVIFITLKGELPIYAGLLLLAPPAPSGSTGSGSTGSDSTKSDVTSAIINGTIDALA